MCFGLRWLVFDLVFHDEGLQHSPLFVDQPDRDLWRSVDRIDLQFPEGQIYFVSFANEFHMVEFHHHCIGPGIVVVNALGTHDRNFKTGTDAMDWRRSLIISYLSVRQRIVSLSSKAFSGK